MMVDLHIVFFLITFHFQVIRSVSQWSAGTSQVEDSIHSAYCSLIDKAEHLIYIEVYLLNPFLLCKHNGLFIIPFKMYFNVLMLCNTIKLTLVDDSYLLGSMLKIQMRYVKYINKH